MVRSALDHQKLHGVESKESAGTPCSRGRTRLSRLNVDTKGNKLPPDEGLTASICPAQFVCARVSVCAAHMRYLATVALLQT